MSNIDFVLLAVNKTETIVVKDSGPNHDWLKIIISILSVLIAVCVPLYIKYLDNRKEKKEEKDEISSMKEIVIGYFNRKLNDSLMRKYEGFTIKSTDHDGETLNQIFNNDNEFNKWLDSVLLTLPKASKRKIITDSRKFLSDLKQSMDFYNNLDKYDEDTYNKSIRKQTAEHIAYVREV